MFLLGPSRGRSVAEGSSSTLGRRTREQVARFKILAEETALDDPLPRNPGKGLQLHRLYRPDLLSGLRAEVKHVVCDICALCVCGRESLLRRRFAAQLQAVRIPLRVVMGDGEFYRGAAAVVVDTLDMQNGLARLAAYQSRDVSWS
jgi:hypothetical protein